MTPPSAASGTTTSETVRELAWAAGFFDGEGTSYAHRCKRANGRVSFYPSMCVSQKDRRPLDRFAAILGGNVRGEQSRLFRWHVTGSKAVAAMERLYPLLTAPKQEQWDAAVEKVDRDDSR